jgi:hypothetical protein
MWTHVCKRDGENQILRMAVVKFRSCEEAWRAHQSRHNQTFTFHSRARDEVINAKITCEVIP